MKARYRAKHEILCLTSLVVIEKLSSKLVFSSNQMCNYFFIIFIHFFLTIHFTFLLFHTFFFLQCSTSSFYLSSKVRKETLPGYFLEVINSTTTKLIQQQQIKKERNWSDTFRIDLRGTKHRKKKSREPKEKHLKKNCGKHVRARCRTRLPTKTPIKHRQQRSQEKKYGV